MRKVSSDLMHEMENFKVEVTHSIGDKEKDLNHRQDIHELMMRTDLERFNDRLSQWLDRFNEQQSSFFRDLFTLLTDKHVKQHEKIYIK